MSNTFESFNYDDEQQNDALGIKECAYDLEANIINAVQAGDIAGVVDSTRAAAVGRYRALALTHLETAIMFANKGISRRYV